MLTLEVAGGFGGKEGRGRATGGRPQTARRGSRVGWRNWGLLGRGGNA